MINFKLIATTGASSPIPIQDLTENQIYKGSSIQIFERKGTVDVQNIEVPCHDIDTGKFHFSPISGLFLGLFTLGTPQEIDDRLSKATDLFKNQANSEALRDVLNTAASLAELLRTHMLGAQANWNYFEALAELLSDAEATLGEAPLYDTEDYKISNKNDIDGLARFICKNLNIGLQITSVTNALEPKVKNFPSANQNDNRVIPFISHPINKLDPQDQSKSIGFMCALDSRNSMAVPQPFDTTQQQNLSSFTHPMGVFPGTNNYIYGLNSGIIGKKATET